MDLSNRIRLARVDKGWNQVDLAKQLGVSRSAVGHWERGAGSTPSPRRLLRLAHLTGVNVQWLATGRGPMRPAGSAEAALPMVALSEEEELLLRHFRRITGRARQLLLESAECWAVQSQGARGAA